jgi:hypothetical protein
MLAFRLELEAYILQLGRVEAVATQTTVAEVQTYKYMVELMDQEKIDTLEAIEELKRELVFVQQERKNKLEYDQLASEIMKYGTREELESQLASLRATISNLTGESSKYTDIMEQSQSRFIGIASELKKLRADVGFEVGERERREVEREGEGDVEEERRAGEEAAEASAAASVRDDGTKEGQDDQRDAQEDNKGGGKLTLNAAAAPFKPRGSTPGLSSSVTDTSSKRRRSTRRAEVDDEDNEEDALAKKRAREEGEMSEEADAEQEEEEGAV